jgi:hypothetical protein
MVTIFLFIYCFFTISQVRLLLCCQSSYHILTLYLKALNNNHFPITVCFLLKEA